MSESPDGARPSLDTVRDVERALAAREAQQAEAERALDDARAQGERLLGEARRRAEAAAADARTARLAAADREAAQIVERARTDAARLTAAMGAHRAETAGELASLVLPAPEGEG